MTETLPETRSITVERDLPHPAEKVWRALTQPHLMAEWLMKTDFAPTVAHRFHLTDEWGGTLDCEVLSVEPPPVACPTLGTSPTAIPPSTCAAS